MLKEVEENVEDEDKEKEEEEEEEEKDDDDDHVDGCVYNAGFARRAWNKRHRRTPRTTWSSRPTGLVWRLHNIYSNVPL